MRTLGVLDVDEEKDTYAVRHSCVESVAQSQYLFFLVINVFCFLGTEILGGHPWIGPLHA